jgi:hypothetical protein
MGEVHEERKAETGDLILQADRRIFSNRGYDKTQIADTVREAGISAGSAFPHLRHIVNGMYLKAAPSLLTNDPFTRREFVNNPLALNRAMFSTCLTDKGRKEPGDLSVPRIFEG